MINWQDLINTFFFVGCFVYFLIRFSLHLILNSFFASCSQISKKEKNTLGFSRHIAFTLVLDVVYSFFGASDRVCIYNLKRSRWFWLHLFFKSFLILCERHALIAWNSNDLSFIICFLSESCHFSAFLYFYLSLFLWPEVLRQTFASTKTWW